MSELKIKNFIYFHFYYLFIFIYFLDLILGFSMTSHMTVTKDIVESWK